MKPLVNGYTEGNPTSRTLLKQQRFLKFFASVGVISKAAELAGVAHSTVTNWRKTDVMFLEQMDEARLVHNDQLESMLFDLISAMHTKLDYKANPTLLIFALNGANPQKYKGLTQVTTDAKDVLSEFRKAVRDSKGVPETPEMDPETDRKLAVKQANDILKSKFGSFNDTST